MLSLVKLSSICCCSYYLDINIRNILLEELTQTRAKHLYRDYASFSSGNNEKNNKLQILSKMLCKVFTFQ